MGWLHGPFIDLHPQRPTTPLQSPFVSPVNSPQATPRTRRRAEIRERNPPESPRRRRVPQHVPQAPAQQRRIPPPRQRHPRRNIARQPLDPNGGDFVHSLQGPFNVAYVQVFLLFSNFNLDVPDVEQFIGSKNEHQNPLQLT